jgi:exodeoxyribonuclease V alpha subunit
MNNTVSTDDNGGDGKSQPRFVIEGTLERVVWSSPDSAFIVGRLRLEDELFPVSIVGEMLSPAIGDTYVLDGAWEEHQRYGKQFRFTSYELVYPTTEDGIIRYLSSGLLRGIGPALARRIVEAFGVDAILVMNEDIDRLMEIDGIGKKKLSMIRASWEEQRGVQHVMLFLKQHGVSTSYAVRLYRYYGTNTVQIVQENPYRLVHDIDGIGFVSADAIARSMGVKTDDPRRLVAGACFVLYEASRRDGHCCIPREEFTRHAASLLGAEEHDVGHGVQQAEALGLLVHDSDMLYIPELYNAELSITESLRQTMAEQWNGIDHLGLDDIVRSLEQRRDIQFNPQQVEAIHKGIAGPVCIITGGPGTGKTTTLLGLLHVASELDLDVAVCAPTGRAARRITEITGFEARTIHRLLEFEPQSGGFLKGSGNPVDVDMLVVDEMSMVDVLLFASLLRARRSGCRLVLLGDADQLPSVGPGTVLRDLIACNEIDTVVLRLIFRQGAQSSIVTNAHRVREGFMPVFDTRLVDGGQTFFRELRENENIAALIRDLVAERIPRELDCHPMHDIQVLAPMYNSPAGVNNLNHVLQQALNAHGRVLLQRGERVFRMGDKVMQTRNDYEKDVYNGDIGFIRSYDEDEQMLSILFDDRSVQYAPEDTDDLTLAYAITIHKSQGSEYRIVIVPMVTQHRIMLRRTLLYTAMTRARDMLVLLGERAAVSMAVRTLQEQRRNSRLRERLIGALR